MEAVLKAIRAEYGDIEGYLRKHTSLTDADFARIRQNLLVTSPLA